MIERIIISGAGGQGIMLLGKILANAAMAEGKYVTCLPAYGAEVRGGTANCSVIISDEEISSPYIGQADSLIIMNAPSLKRFCAKLKKQGHLFLNSSLVGSAAVYSLKGIKVIAHPFTDMAIRLGNIKVANMAALGCFSKVSNVVKLSSILKVIIGFAPKDKPELIEINKKALQEGSLLK